MSGGGCEQPVYADKCNLSQSRAVAEWAANLSMLIRLYNIHLKVARVVEVVSNLFMLKNATYVRLQQW